MVFSEIDPLHYQPFQRHSGMFVKCCIMLKSKTNALDLNDHCRLVNTTTPAAAFHIDTYFSDIVSEEIPWCGE